MISSWILRTFALARPSATNLKLYESYALPILLCASAAWDPNRKGHVAKLRKVDTRFIRRVEYRCILPKLSLEIVDVMDRLNKIDVQLFRKLIRTEVSFDEVFVLRHATIRSGFVLSTHTVPKTVTLEQHYIHGD